MGEVGERHQRRADVCPAESPDAIWIAGGGEIAREVVSGRRGRRRRRGDLVKDFDGFDGRISIRDVCRIIAIGPGAAALIADSSSGIDVRSGGAGAVDDVDEEVAFPWIKRECIGERHDHVEVFWTPCRAAEGAGHWQCPFESDDSVGTNIIIKGSLERFGL